MDVRLARLEERMDAARDAAAVFRDGAVERMLRIEINQQNMSAKLDAIAADIAAAKTTWSVSTGLLGWMRSMIPAGAVAAAVAAAAHWIWPGK